MIDLARRWCEILDLDPSAHPDPPTPDPSEFPGQLAAAIIDYLAAAEGTTPAAYTDAHLAAKHTAPAHWTLRDPTDDEQATARHLAARLRQARTRQPEPARQPSAIPPGRLRTRHAITADAQAAAGQIPTAAPWQRRAAVPPDKPTLHLAVLVDVSGSMHTYAPPMSSAGWILAHAAHHTHAITTTIAFGDQVTLLHPPRHKPTHVLEMAALDSTEEFTDAVKLADHLLDLRRRNTLRMLAVVSDGQFSNIPAAQKLLTTLHHSGCPILWLQPAGLTSHTYTHTTAVTVTNPVDAIDHIAAAAITAFTNA